jgi:hypothetical protein
LNGSEVSVPDLVVTFIVFVTGVEVIQVVDDAMAFVYEGLDIFQYIRSKLRDTTEVSSSYLSLHLAVRC